MIIAFNGGMGSGKSTAIELIRGMTGLVLPNVKFAQPLYDMQEMIYGRISSVYQRPENFVKDRKLLQWLGTEWGRDTISKTIWIDIWRAEVERLEKLHKVVVCDDVRFENEAQTVKAMGGTVIKISALRGQDRTVSGIANHSSEAGLPNELVDYIVENNSTMEDYKNSLGYLVTQNLGLGIRR